MFSAPSSLRSGAPSACACAGGQRSLGTAKEGVWVTGHKPVSKVHSLALKRPAWSENGFCILRDENREWFLCAIHRIILSISLDVPHPTDPPSCPRFNNLDFLLTSSSLWHPFPWICGMCPDVIMVSLSYCFLVDSDRFYSLLFCCIPPPLFLFSPSASFCRRGSNMYPLWPQSLLPLPLPPLLLWHGNNLRT